MNLGTLARACALLLSAAAAGALSQDPAAPPSPPYYSVQLMSLSTQAAALQELEAIKDQPLARAELRDGLYLIRVGAWDAPEPARKERDVFREKGQAAARVVKVSRAVPWLLPGAKGDGSAAAAVPPAADTKPADPAVPP